MKAVILVILLGTLFGCGSDESEASRCGEPNVVCVDDLSEFAVSGQLRMTGFELPERHQLDLYLTDEQFIRIQVVWTQDFFRGRETPPEDFTLGPDDNIVVSIDETAGTVTGGRISATFAEPTSNVEDRFVIGITFENFEFTVEGQTYILNGSFEIARRRMNWIEFLE